MQAEQGRAGHGKQTDRQTVRQAGRHSLPLDLTALVKITNNYFLCIDLFGAFDWDNGCWVPNNSNTHQYKSS